MRQWYDGYLLDGNHIYNPRSVTGALDSKEFRSYWTGWAGLMKSLNR